jgi:O-antigen/teichoic acid export membrane protein
LAGNGSLQLLGLGTSILAARLFRPEARGELAAAVTWALILTALADLGLSQAVPVFSAKGRSGISAAAAAVAFGTSALLAPVFLILPGVLGFHPTAAAFCYSIVGVPFGLTTGYLAAACQGASRHTAFNTIRIVGSLPYGIGLCLALFPFRRSPDVVLWSSLAMTIVACLALAWWASRFTTALRRPDLDGLIAYGLRGYPGNLAWTATQRVPLLLVGGMSGSAALGYFTVAQSYAVVPFAVGSAFALLGPGRIAALTGRPAVRASRSLARWGILATWLVALVFLPLTGPVVRAVYGADYAASTGAAVVLVLASGFLGTNFILSACLRALRRPAAPSYAEAAGLAIALAACPVAIHWLGWTGAAWTTLAAAAAVTAILTALLTDAHNDGSHPSEDLRPHAGLQRR